MSSYFYPLRKSIFWHNEVAMDLLQEISVVNDLLLYNKLSIQKKQVSEFRKSLANLMLSLLLDDQLQQANCIKMQA